MPNTRAKKKKKNITHILCSVRGRVCFVCMIMYGIIYTQLDTDMARNAGLLSPLGDPLGKALNKGLSPVGSVVGGLAQPFGSGASNTDKLRGTSKDAEASSSQSHSSLGGKEQTGQNPLGL